MEVEEWKRTGPFTFTSGGYILVPESRADIIRRQCTSITDEKKEAATYYVTCHPSASWGKLAKRLYQAGEKRAVEAFKAQLPNCKQGNQCDCVVCVGAVCSKSLHTCSALRKKGFTVT